MEAGGAAGAGEGVSPGTGARGGLAFSVAAASGLCAWRVLLRGPGLGRKKRSLPAPPAPEAVCASTEPADPPGWALSRTVRSWSYEAASSPLSPGLWSNLPSAGLRHSWVSSRHGVATRSRARQSVTFPPDTELLDISKVGADSTSVLDGHTCRRRWAPAQSWRRCDTARRPPQKTPAEWPARRWQRWAAGSLADQGKMWARERGAGTPGSGAEPGRAGPGNQLWALGGSRAQAERGLPVSSLTRESQSSGWAYCWDAREHASVGQEDHCVCWEGGAQRAPERTPTD